MIRREFKVGERVWLKQCASGYGPPFNTAGVIEQADRDNTSLVQWPPGTSNTPHSWHPNFVIGRIVEVPRHE